MPPLKEDFELALCGWFTSFVTWGGLVCLERRLLSILQGWGVLEEVVVLVIQHWEESGILLKLDLKGIKLEVTFARVVTEDFECQWFIDISWKCKGKELVPDWSYLGIQDLAIVLTKSNMRVGVGIRTPFWQCGTYHLYRSLWLHEIWCSRDCYDHKRHSCILESYASLKTPGQSQHLA